MSDEPQVLNWTRRQWLTAASLGAAALSTRLTGSQGATADQPAAKSAALANAIHLGDKLVEWQSPFGGPDLEKCPHRSKRAFDPGLLHGIGPSVRSLYRLYEATNDERYSVAADRYAVFYMATLHEPITPYSNIMRINGLDRHMMSAAWMYGKGLSPCYEEFVRRHPKEDAFELRALSFHRSLQEHRRDDSYFGVGYPRDKKSDAQFSCDLGEVGRGLIGYYEVSKNPDALTDARGLARYFLTDYSAGSGVGIWSPKLGVWLVGPWPGSGAEHFTDQTFNETGWGWSCWVVGDYLLTLLPHVEDESVRSDIVAKCVGALKWCLDTCQFDDGAHGMFSRDDRWVGMTAVPVLLYSALQRSGLVPAEFEASHRGKVDNAWNWLLSHTSAETYPEDGYIKVTGKTSKKPAENLVWLTAWTVEALLAGRTVFSS